jgi:hypothetical protein
MAPKAEVAPASHHTSMWLSDEHLASYLLGIMATLVATGGLYLVKDLRWRMAAAIIAASVISIWFARTAFRLVMLQSSGHMQACVPEGVGELRRSWPVVLAAIPPVLTQVAAGLGLWSVTLGLHFGQALGICGLVIAGVLTGRRQRVTGWALASYVGWLGLTGFLVAGLELLARTV